MDKKYITSSLKSVGYSDHAIKSILERKKCSRPLMEKQYELLDFFNIPLEAWRDIKSYIQNHNTQSKELQDV